MYRKVLKHQCIYLRYEYVDESFWLFTVASFYIMMKYSTFKLCLRIDAMY